MNTVTRIGIALCFVFGLLANLANADQPKKSDLEARIISLEKALILPISPPSITTAGCVIGTLAICHRRDGTVVSFCTGIPCEDTDPYPDSCPEVCEAQGDIVVVDYARDPCDQPYPFVCMTPSEYAARPTCDAFFVLHYNSDMNGWVCERSFEIEHLSRSVFEALLFESTRTNFLYNEIVNKPQ